MNESNGAMSSDIEISYYLEEIKSMRDEINWRVKMAYTGSLIFLSAIVVPLSAFFDKDNTLIDYINTNGKDSSGAIDTLTIVGMIAIMAICAWTGVQNANHIIEKRIELYTLELMKVVIKTKGHPYSSWLAYLYGSTFFKNKTKAGIAKLLNASIGFFIYFLPNIISILGWFLLVREGTISEYLSWFIILTIFILIVACSTLMFFFYVTKINKDYSRFYKEHIEPYFERYSAME